MEIFLRDAFATNHPTLTLLQSQAQAWRTHHHQNADYVHVRVINT